jgi:hypothetical protein
VVVAHRRHPDRRLGHPRHLPHQDLRFIGSLEGGAADAGLKASAPPEAGRGRAWMRPQGA